MPTFRVTWSLDVEAPDAISAALQVAQRIADGNTTPLDDVFSVQPSGPHAKGDPVAVDLMDHQLPPGEEPL